MQIYRLPGTSGLSPRVRGNHGANDLALHRRRSIPACAGKPVHTGSESFHFKVYPRVCGETTLAGDMETYVSGLSPRVRGTRDVARSDMFVCGLSPRVRGNLRALYQCLPRFRSIPACAGKPLFLRARTPCTPVYPRVCGETRPIPVHGAAWHGLSPRVRGNPILPGAMVKECRSIPACAGKPHISNSALGPGRVYPRVCGKPQAVKSCRSQRTVLSPRVRGTCLSRTRQIALRGLSPRVRGNRHRHVYAVAQAGSIPACAGKPPPTPPTAGPTAVYPRVCGETTRTMSGGR